MSEGQVTLFIDEEYGYREWVWETGMTASQLRDWWEALPTVAPAFMDPSQAGWPGVWKRVEAVYPEIPEGINWDDEEAVEELRQEQEAGIRFHIFDGDGEEVILTRAQMDELRAKAGGTGHIHTDEDSGISLKAYPGEEIHHGGYEGEPYDGDVVEEGE